MKRKTIAAPRETAKRLRLDPGKGDLEKSKSPREQAEPYRLATARFRIEALTSTWSLGSNRHIHENHVQSLCRIFEEQGLQREPVENHLLVACSKDEVQRIVAHLEEAGHNMSERESNYSPWPAFDDWMAVVGSKAEIMAGQHRVEALKLYLRRMSSSSGLDAPIFEKEQSWWICDIYDKDRLPAHLSVKLRANRQGSILPDSHGQVWMELATLAAADTSLFKGPNAQVQAEMLRALGLSGRVPFPIRRLMTLWKNRSWRPMITRWCSTDLGRETFNVSLWEEMARHRIDDFWFDTFETVLESASKLQGTGFGTLKLEDWTVLARILPCPSPSRSAKDIHSLFYPSTSPALMSLDPKLPHLYPPRRPKFLLTLPTPALYHSAYQTLLAHPALPLPDFQTLFRIGRPLGKVLSQAMVHVGLWLNPCPLQVSERENNKPQLWRDLVPAFRDEGGEGGGEEGGKAEEKSAEQQAVRLQREIFEVVRARFEEFSATGPGDCPPAAAAYLMRLPRTSVQVNDGSGKSGSRSDEVYLERFLLPVWRDLLITVHAVAGKRSRFQGPLARFNTAELPASILLSAGAGANAGAGAGTGAGASANTGAAVGGSALSRRSEPASLARVVRDAISRVPEVRLHPALGSVWALEALMVGIGPVVEEWAVRCGSGEEGGGAVKVQSQRMSPSWRAVEEKRVIDDDNDNNNGDKVIETSGDGAQLKVGITSRRLGFDERNELRRGPLLEMPETTATAASVSMSGTIANDRRGEGGQESAVEISPTAAETLQMSGGVLKMCRLERQREDFEMNRSSILKVLNA